MAAVSQQALDMAKAFRRPRPKSKKSKSKKRSFPRY